MLRTTWKTACAYYDAIEETYALVAALGKRGIAYVHLMDQSGFFYDKGSAVPLTERINALLRDFRKKLPGTALILAGGMTRERAEALIAEDAIDLASFGQPFTSNPDLVARLWNNWAPTPSDRETYCGGGTEGFMDDLTYQPA